MGATGAGKSKLSIDLSAMFSGEVVNSDKIQVYRGLDITTSKIPVVERSGGSNSFMHALLLERYDSRPIRLARTGSRSQG
ncbi:Adenylate isopentenyltransferase [Musa troglodytarum]|uniref:Adenylate isopentenyltransferase n=1 Tax=Musa troglodytarum TaxID=320322 RepID=A0A9E7JN53_9LILI|nr:Adenylate isopentenyltransferase [Musa troglodytarum]